MHSNSQLQAALTTTLAVCLVLAKAQSKQAKQRRADANCKKSKHHVDCIRQDGVEQYTLWHRVHVVQVEIDALKPGVVQNREPAKPQRQTYYARRFGQQAYGSGSRLIGSLQAGTSACHRHMQQVALYRLNSKHVELERSCLVPHVQQIALRSNLSDVQAVHYNAW